MRTVEQTGESIVITDHGKPVLELKPYTPPDVDPLKRKGIQQRAGTC